jgi:hypothetical protein
MMTLVDARLRRMRHAHRIARFLVRSCGGAGEQK